MNILITNDDGLGSPGLERLIEEYRDKHDIWVVAPDGERSGSSHAITLKGAVRFQQFEERIFSCSGTPVDCVLMSVLGAVPEKPDLVLSGINLGPNIGTDILYSGTAAAARQAALMDIPGVALSLNAFQPPYYFESVIDFLSERLENMVNNWSGDHFLNVNAPNINTSRLEAEITRPARRIYRDSLDSFLAPDGSTYYFLKGGTIEHKEKDGSDWSAIERGMMSVTPVYLHPLDHQQEGLTDVL
ncbi:MAG: 5'/3'-nucleotidase SurE [Spirochaetales bacterium]|nr:5'/3'-nucleotidase SurE [Spirochaetales bacterium]MCF7937047.1 5'/3'-nucleotidase SurE [Spirochaetales bacterium]